MSCHIISCSQHSSIAGSTSIFPNDLPPLPFPLPPQSVSAGLTLPTRPHLTLGSPPPAPAPAPSLGRWRTTTPLGETSLLIGAHALGIPVTWSLCARRRNRSSSTPLHERMEKCRNGEKAMDAMKLKSVGVVRSRYGQSMKVMDSRTPGPEEDWYAPSQDVNSRSTPRVSLRSRDFRYGFCMIQCRSWKDVIPLRTRRRERREWSLSEARFEAPTPAREFQIGVPEGIVSFQYLAGRVVSWM